MADLKKVIGQRLRDYRNAKGYSIEELAHIADLNAVHLASLERGEKNFTISTLEKVVTALGISFIDVFSFEQPVETPADPVLEKISALTKNMAVEEREFIYQTIHFLNKNKEK